MCPFGDGLVSEWIFSSTSAQLGYTVPFTLVHAENTGQKTKIQTICELNTTRNKQTMQNTAKQSTMV